MTGAEPKWGLVLHNAQGHPIYVDHSMTLKESQDFKEKLPDMALQIVTNEEAMKAVREAMLNC